MLFSYNYFNTFRTYTNIKSKETHYSPYMFKKTPIMQRDTVLPIKRYISATFVIKFFSVYKLINNFIYIMNIYTNNDLSKYKVIVI